MKRSFERDASTTAPSDVIVDDERADDGARKTEIAKHRRPRVRLLRERLEHQRSAPRALELGDDARDRRARERRVGQPARRFERQRLIAVRWRRSTRSASSSSAGASFAKTSSNLPAPLVSSTSAQLRSTSSRASRRSRPRRRSALAGLRSARSRSAIGRACCAAVSRRGADDLGRRPLHLGSHRRPFPGRGRRLRRCCRRSSSVSPAADTSGTKIPAYFIAVIPRSRGGPRLWELQKPCQAPCRRVGTTIAQRTRMPAFSSAAN